jgi:pimeloyl-ACP methyl ester carboxylesterase
MSDTTSTPLPALGICLEEYEYPYPVRFLPLSNDLQQVTMAYMDIPPSTEPNEKTVVLMHGKAFGCYYFRNVIEALTAAGYRVVAPDQIGWGKPGSRHAGGRAGGDPPSGRMPRPSRGTTSQHGEAPARLRDAGSAGRPSG